jgi:hypothetical protein
VFISEKAPAPKKILHEQNKHIDAEKERQKKKGREQK